MNHLCFIRRAFLMQGICWSCLHTCAYLVLYVRSWSQPWWSWKWEEWGRKKTWKWKMSWTECVLIFKLAYLCYLLPSSTIPITKPDAKHYYSKCKNHWQFRNLTDNIPSKLTVSHPTADSEMAPSWITYIQLVKKKICTSYWLLWLQKLIKHGSLYQLMR